MKNIPVESPLGQGQAGGGMLTMVAVLGGILMLVQGTVYYKSKGSTRFLGSEKSKVLAQQMAEAGVEDNIADLGRRKIRIGPGFHDSTTHEGKHFGNGTYTTRLSMVGTGSDADTVDLVSTGSVGRGSQSVQARMKLRKVMDTTRTPRVTVKPETTYAYASRSQSDTLRDTVLFNAASLPALNMQAAYTACMNSSANKCDLCHLPPGNPSNVHVISVAKSAIRNSHVPHHGDYISTDGTCDLYKDRVNMSISMRTFIDTTRTIVDKTIYDTTVVIDTAVKVQILTWR